MISAYDHDGLSACVGAHAPRDACQQAVGSFIQRFEQISHLHRPGSRSCPA